MGTAASDQQLLARHAVTLSFVRRPKADGREMARAPRRGWPVVAYATGIARRSGITNVRRARSDESVSAK